MVSKPVARVRPADRGPTLLRQLGFLSATALVVSNMVGTGIFTATGFLAGDLGTPFLVLLIWAVGAVCALAGALCYSELGINFPSSGGEYVYLDRAYGPTWAFMTGWVSFFAGFSAPIAAASLAFADYLGYFFPALRQERSPVLFTLFDTSIRLGGAQLTACLLIALFTALNCVGVRRTARVQNVLTALKIAVLVAFLAGGILFGQGSWSHLHQAAVRTSTTPLPAQFAVSLCWIYAAYSGWNAATYIAEELQQPSRTLPLALTCGTALVAVLYIGLNLVFLYALPLEEMKGHLAIGSFAAMRLFGPQIAGGFSALMALGLVSSVNAMVTIGPRVYYAMAKNRAFFAAAATVHPRWRTPVNSILSQALCAMLMTLVPFQELFLYIGFSLNIFAVLSVASLFRFRRRPHWHKLRVVSVAFPLIPAVFMLVGFWIFLYGLLTRPLVSGSALLTVAVGAVAYHFFHRPQLSSVPE